MNIMLTAPTHGIPTRQHPSGETILSRLGCLTQLSEYEELKHECIWPVGCRCILLVVLTHCVGLSAAKGGDVAMAPETDGGDSQ